MSRSVERTLWLIRHAHRLDWADPCWARTAERPHDPPLSDTGRQQARRIAQRLAAVPIAHIFVSPFLRTIETAVPLAAVHGLPMAIEPGFSEWLNVAWFPEPPETAPLSKLRARFPIDCGYRPRATARYGESGREALDRAGKTMRQLLRDFDGNLVIVGHGASVLGAARSVLGTDEPGPDQSAQGDDGERDDQDDPVALPPGLPRELPHGCIIRIERYRGEWHLAGMETTDVGSEPASSDDTVPRSPDEKGQSA
jgi:broad specificity phosphatase PhoE